MKTLSDLHWFSFAQDLNKIEALTVWQAIGHILSHTPKAEAAFEQYVEDLTQLETDCANDIIDFNDESGRSTLVMIGGEIKAITTEDSGSHKYGLDHIVLPTETIRA